MSVAVARTGSTADKKPLAEWNGWRGEISVNRHIRAGVASVWDGKLWCGSEKDRAELERLIADDRLAE